MNSIVLDLREDLRKGASPFERIMSAAAKLEVGEKLLLLTPFEPVPLFHALAQKGFSHLSREMESGDWETSFTLNNPVVKTATTAANPAAKTPAAKTIELDARGLQPPQPLVTILEAVATLPDNAELKAWTDRRPMHLYPELESRGFQSRTEEQSDGSFITHISHS